MWANNGNDHEFDNDGDDNDNDDESLMIMMIMMTMKMIMMILMRTMIMKIVHQRGTSQPAEKPMWAPAASNSSCSLGFWSL